MPTPSMNRRTHKSTREESTSSVEIARHDAAAIRAPVTGIHLMRSILEAHTPERVDRIIMPASSAISTYPESVAPRDLVIWMHVGM